jgi:2-polyprenyl-6-methoxyphenol hydroxylase-like FAD-dependent oxidoreductase
MNGGPAAERFDVIIVGARCAGSPLATMLARAGLKVCVVDRAQFPSETPSTHAVQPCGVKILDDLGILEPLLEVAPAMEHGTMVMDEARIELGELTELVGAPMVNARRITLDAILMDAAVGAGADVRTGTTVTGLVEERGRVVGVETTTGKLLAPLLVGADGARSSVARMVGASEYHRTAPGCAFLWGYLEGVPADNDGLWLGKIGDRGFLASQTDGGLFMAALVLSLEHREELRRDREAAYDSGLAYWPELHASLGGGRRVGPVRMMSRWHGFFRESAGPGWVLVGDAGHFKDPTPGQGISDALRQSAKLAPAIERALGGSQSADRILRDWWAWRDQDAWEMYWFAYDMGAPGPTPLLVQAIQERIAADQQLSESLLRVINHDVEPSKALGPGLALAAAFEAFRTRRGQRKLLLREARTVFGNQVRRRALRRLTLPASSRRRFGRRALVGSNERSGVPAETLRRAVPG